MHIVTLIFFPVAAFGGDQFKLPEQRAELTRYFSIFYFTIQLGSVISTTITPILRADVHCFGDNNCYSLAFAVPAVLMIMSICKFFLFQFSNEIMSVNVHFLCGIFSSFLNW